MKKFRIQGIPSISNRFLKPFQPSEYHSGFSRNQAAGHQALNSLQNHSCVQNFPNLHTAALQSNPNAGELSAEYGLFFLQELLYCPNGLQLSGFVCSMTEFPFQTALHQLALSAKNPKLPQKNIQLLFQNETSFCRCGFPK